MSWVDLGASCVSLSPSFSNQPGPDLPEGNLASELDADLMIAALDAQGEDNNNDVGADVENGPEDNDEISKHEEAMHGGK
eukprot:12399054-Karenia_brevis.AAC.1